ncbi:MAG: 50S ribosomal protein L30 [Candidatus Aenigmarchaeota archaeon]|nr:50S ribosomal protein L30 [Candidatus Aenigmarchaeota archaeon]
MYAVIRVRGLNHIRKPVKDTFTMLRLHRKMHCVLLEDTPINKGMIQKVKDWTTFGEINDDVLKAMIAKRGRKLGDVRLTPEEVETVFQEIKSGKKPKDTIIKPVFRLTPPSGGFKKSIKGHYPKGELGSRGDKINDLIKRMI